MGLWIIDIKKKEGGVSQLDSVQRASPSGFRIVKKMARSRGMGIPDQVIDTQEGTGDLVARKSEQAVSREVPGR